MTNENEVIDEMNTNPDMAAAEAPGAKTEKPAAEVEVHAKAKAVSKAFTMESSFHVGEIVTVSGVELKVIKRDGLTLTLRRTDIVA